MANTTKDTVLTVEKLCVGYKGEVIQRNVSFVLGASEICLINGSNGSGKTTLIRTLLNQLKPISGNFSWHLKKDQISSLEQKNRSELSLSITVKEVMDLYDIPKKALSMVPDALLPKKWIDLSGGEKQIVLITTRVSEKTKILILDEPFNHLDQKAILRVSKFIENLVGRGVSFLIISHQKMPAIETKITEVNLT
ncbi:ATP-binding cassette domain-containing protein [bacterium]|nr:ATP-binding cassette domain-containing protein [bacterium]